MNMRMKRIVSCWFLLCCLVVSGQKDGKLDFPKLHIWKSGPYFGVQRGKYWVGELGAEFQWKKVKLVSTLSQGMHTGVNYNFTNNVLGYDLGYWIKPSRLGLTYGGNMFYRTNFSGNNVGFAPCLGYKVFGFHLQTGYQFLLGSKNLVGVNTFFVSLRFVIINHRDTKVRR